MKPDNILTKKKFMYGLRCLKYLWGISKDSNPSLESNIIAQHRIREGRLVRELVQQLYPGGVNVATESFMDCVEQTRVFVKQHKLLYEAGVLVDNIYSNINILKPVDDDSWDIIDIKNSRQPFYKVKTIAYLSLATLSGYSNLCRWDALNNLTNLIDKTSKHNN